MKGAQASSENFGMDRFSPKDFKNSIKKFATITVSCVIVSSINLKSDFLENGYDYRVISSRLVLKLNVSFYEKMLGKMFSP